MSTIKRAMTSCLFVAALLASAQLAYAQRDPGGRSGSPEVRGAIKSIDAGSITLSFGGGRETPAVEKTYAIAKNVEVCVGAGGGFRLGNIFKEAKLADVSAGTFIMLTLSADSKTVESLVAEEPVVRGTLKAVDAKKNTLTISLGAGRDGGAGEEQSYAVAADAEVAIDDGRGRRTSIREGKLDELVPGAMVSVRLSLDKKQARGVYAEGSMVMGTVKEIDAAKRTITLTIRPARGDDAAEERSLVVAKEAIVMLDDGKGRRLSVKEAKLAEIPVGASIMGKLSVDQGFVMMLKAEGPTMNGILKGVDADKGTITIGIPINRTEFEEKTLTLAKDAHVSLDGKDAKLADLKVGENGPYIQLRLAFDQKTVQSVRAQQPGSR